MSGIISVNNSNYNITSGKTQIDGTYYNVSNGKVLIEGTIYSINFLKDIKLITISIKGSTGNANNNYVLINNIKYYSPTTITIPDKTVIHCKSSLVKLNGQYQGTNYDYTLKGKNITINFNSIFIGLIPAIDISEGA